MIAELQQAGRRRPGRRTARRAVRPHAAALQAAGAVQLLRSSASSTSGWPGGRIRGWPPAPSSSPALASTALGRVVAPHEILFDAPPVAREVQFNVEIHFPKESRYRPLGEVSPVIRTLATRAVRRLREARPHLRPSPDRRRPPPAAQPAGVAGSGDYADGVTAASRPRSLPPSFPVGVAVALPPLSAV